MKLLIVDDHQLVAEGIKAFISKKLSGIEISTVSDRIEAKKAYMQTPALDLLICDLNLNGVVEGFEIVKSALQKNPNLRVIVLSMHSEKALIRSAFSHGAHGYVLKTDPPEEIFNVIEAVMQGNFFSSKSIPKNLSSEASTLTAREEEVAMYVAKGKTSKQIAELLHISVRTVEVHRRSIMNKLGVDNVAQLVLVQSSRAQN